MKRNVANQHINATLVDAAGDVVDSGTTSVFVTGDNGTRTAGGGTVTNKTNGDWDYGPTQAETNYSHIKFTFVNSGAITIGLNVYTNQSVDQSGDSYPEVDARLPATLIDGRMRSDLQAMRQSEEAAIRLSEGSAQLRNFEVQAGPTATSIPTNIFGAPYSTADHYAGRVVTINEETRKILSSAGSPVVLTVEDFNSVPAQNDKGLIS